MRVPLLLTEPGEVHQVVGRVELGDLIQVDETGFEAIIGGNRLPGQPSAEKDRQQVVGTQRAVIASHDDIVDIDQSEQFSLDTGFLADLAQSGAAGGFPSFDMATWQAPDEPSWILAAQSDQEFAVIAENRGTGCGLRPMARGKPALRVGVCQSCTLPGDKRACAGLKALLDRIMIATSYSHAR